MDTTSTKYIKGGAFLLGEADPETVFTPEDFTEEHQMLRDSLQDFLEKEVEPHREAFD